MNSLALVILAGGAGTRLGGCKALADLGGTTPLAELLAAGARLVPPAALVVAGAEHARIRAALPPHVELVHNHEWERGRTSSVRAAIRARPGFDLCLAPVDVPLVPARVFEALARAWEEAGAPEFGWLAPSCAPESGAGVAYGHPVLLGRALCRAILESDDDRPLKEFRSGARPLWNLAFECREILDDLDTPEDLATLRARRGF